MSRLKVPHRVSLAVTAMILAGCYSYIPTDMATVPAGDNVRIYVTRQAVIDLAEVTPLGEPIVRGMVVRHENDGLFLRIPIAYRQEGFHSAPINSEVLIPSRDIIQVERRKFDRIATGAMVAGTVGAAGVVVFVIMSAFSDDNVIDQCDGDCTELLSPFISLRVRP